MSKSFDRILTSIVVLVLLSYVGFTGFRYIYSPYKTMIAYSHLESDSLRSRALLLRDESVLGDTTTLNTYYLLEDASMVEAEQEVAVEYASAEDIRAIDQIKSYTQEIEGLSSAAALKMGFLSTDYLNTQLQETISRTSESSADQNAQNIPQLTATLTELINKKQVAIGRENNFGERIGYLQAQKSYLENSLSPPVKSIVSSSGGYFTSHVDGYESQLRASNRLNISVQQYQDLLRGDLAAHNSNNVGKIVTSHNWYLATEVEPKQLEKFYVGQRVGLGFDVESALDIDGIVSDILTDSNTSNAIVLIRCNYVTPALINLRYSAVDIRFNTYSGIRIHADSIRYNDNNEAGVFVIEGNLIVFKRIEIFHQTDTYALCNDNSQLNNPIKLFDEVIISGTDIYDGKVIKQYQS